MSNVAFGMKAFYNIVFSRCKKINMNKWPRSDLHNCSIVMRIFSRHNSLLGCRRFNGRFFCSVNNNVKRKPDCNFTAGNKVLTNITINAIKSYTEEPIVREDLSKALTIYDSSKSIIEKMTTFNRDKCGKFINITKEFLCDPKFLRFAYSLIKNNRGVDKNLDGINDKWFETAASQINNSSYKFKTAKQHEIPKPGGNGKTRILTITNGRDKIIQKAMAIILEMVYENHKLFQEESHGFRPNKSCHSALKTIKFGWNAVPYYIEADVSKAFDKIHRNTLINIMKKDISDKRFLDLICKMYNVNILCLEGF